VVLTFEDITRHVLADQALAEEKERARVTLHSIGDAVIHHRPDGARGVPEPGGRAANRLDEQARRAGCP